MSTSNDKDLLISIPGQGKEVRFAKTQKENGLILKRAAKKGYYYPMLAMKHLQALSTGLTGKRNVFIPNINDFKTNIYQRVVVFVPGIKAIVERRPNDSLIVTELYLDPDESYMQIERGSMIKPGIYQVSNVDGVIKVNYKSNGRITPKDERKVAIADTKFSDPSEAAEVIKEKLGEMFGNQAALKCDFDLFYSPIGASLGGMRNYNPSILSEAYAFSGLLADAMEQSINKKNVEWVSQHSGSVVMTQAMQILALKNLSFSEAKHTVGMHMPTTNPLPTLQAANQLGMLAQKNMAKGNGNIRASVSCLMTNAKRARDKNDSYSWKDYSKDMATGGMAGVGAASALILGASVVVNSPALGTAGAVTGTLGAIQFAYNTVKKRISRG